MGARSARWCQSRDAGRGPPGQSRSASVGSPPRAVSNGKLDALVLLDGKLDALVLLDGKLDALALLDGRLDALALSNGRPDALAVPRCTAVVVPGAKRAAAVGVTAVLSGSPTPDSIGLSPQAGCPWRRQVATRSAPRCVLPTPAPVPSKTMRFMRPLHQRTPELRGARVLGGDVRPERC